MAEENAKSILTPYSSGNGFDTWKRMMRVRMHQARLPRTSQLHNSDSKLAENKDAKVLDSSSNKMLVAKSSVTIGGNPTRSTTTTKWAFGPGQITTRTSTPNGTLTQRVNAPPPPPQTPGFPTLGTFNVTRSKPNNSLLSNTRGLVILSDNIHSRTRKRIQRYSAAKKRQAGTTTATQTATAAVEAKTDAEGGRYDTYYMILVPEPRAAAVARCEEEVEKFNRIINWLQDCKIASENNQEEQLVDLPVIKEEKTAVR